MSITRVGETPAPVEVEEPSFDSDSVGVREQFVKKEEERKERRMKKLKEPPTRKILLRTPSRREAFGKWRRKSCEEWSWMDLIGYFICEFERTRQVESREFFTTTAGILAKVVPNIRGFVERWLDGDLYKAKELVDLILVEAEPRGMPVKLGYFFLPRSEGAALRLEEPIHRNRPEAPYESNDRRSMAADTDARAEKWAAEYRAKKAKEAADVEADAG